MAAVMIVDDDAVLHELYEAALGLAGHEVCAKAFDGRSAVSAFLNDGPHPDVIVMDHRMPHLSGLDAAREILALDPGARILFVSADPSVRAAALEAGALAFLVKPFALGDLSDALERVCPAPTPLPDGGSPMASAPAQ